MKKLNEPKLPKPAPIRQFSAYEIRAYAAELGVPVSKRLLQQQPVGEVAHA